MRTNKYQFHVINVKVGSDSLYAPIMVELKTQENTIRKLHWDNNASYIKFIIQEITTFPNL